MPTLADYPHLAAQLDQAKNGPLAPETLPSGTGRRLWWRCPEGPDHRWEGTVAARTKHGDGCPFCAGRRVSVTNALSRVAPAVARQWHPTKNGDLRARDVVAGSHRVAWWKCPKGPDHEWSAKIEGRCQGQGCPFCSGRRATRARNLAVVSPGVALEWHPTANGDLRPEDVSPFSNRSFWWTCASGHEWSASANARARGGCPYCSGRRVSPDRTLRALAPAVARQWHPTRNGALTPRDVTMSSSRRAWWKCPEGDDHEWSTPVARRGAGGAGCPFCAGLRVSATSSLAALRPELAAQWHPRKNGRLTPRDVTLGSGRRVWWKCPEGADHEWQASVATRRESGCPCCANKAVSATNALSKVAPAIARQWHPTRNGDLRPGQVVAGSHLEAWWKCPRGPDHEWSTTIQQRTHLGTGCPFCAGHRATAARNLAVASPHLVPEWHPTANRDLRPEGVTPGSSTKVWWSCARGHEWRATPKSRAKGTGCPYCAGNLVTPETSLAALAPALAREWHPTRNGQLTPRDVTLHAAARVWWRCRGGPDHEWQTRVADRQESGCPFCSSKRLSATNSLAAVSPELAAEWHPTKNGRITPGDVTARSGRSAWWKCPHGPDHEWRAVIADRHKGPICPFCRNRRVSVTNSLAAVHPKIAADWHPTKNGRLTPRDVTYGATARVWWRCAFGHEWRTPVSGRTDHGAGCLQCYRQRRPQPVATTGRRRSPVRLAAYEGARHGPARRVT